MHGHLPHCICLLWFDKKTLMKGPSALLISFSTFSEEWGSCWDLILSSVAQLSDKSKRRVDSSYLHRFTFDCEKSQQKKNELAAIPDMVPITAVQSPVDATWRMLLSIWATTATAPDIATTLVFIWTSASLCWSASRNLGGLKASLEIVCGVTNSILYTQFGLWLKVET